MLPGIWLASCDAVITCLPSPQASGTVLRELLAADFQGTWIEMSTLGRDEIVELASWRRIMACARSNVR